MSKLVPTKQNIYKQPGNGFRRQGGDEQECFIVRNVGYQRQRKNNNAVHNLAFVQQCVCKMKTINQSVGYCIWLVYIKCVGLHLSGCHHVVCMFLNIITVGLSVLIQAVINLNAMRIGIWCRHPFVRCIKETVVRLCVWHGISHESVYNCWLHDKASSTNPCFVFFSTTVYSTKHLIETRCVVFRNNLKIHWCFRHFIFANKSHLEVRPSIYTYNDKVILWI